LPGNISGYRYAIKLGPFGFSGFNSGFAPISPLTFGGGYPGAGGGFPGGFPGAVAGFPGAYPGAVGGFPGGSYPGAYGTSGSGYPGTSGGFPSNSGSGPAILDLSGIDLDAVRR
jgi:hypothetical protein